MANVTEGFDRQSKKEFVKFLYYALGSVSEVESHLYVALDQHYIGEGDFDTAYQ
jgi:four helix bundle protein